MAFEGRPKRLPPHIRIISLYTIESLEPIGDGTLGIHLCVVVPSKKQQQFIAYERKALNWLSFTPRKRAEFDGKEVLNINDEKQYWKDRGKQMGLIIKTTGIFQTLYIEGLAKKSDAPPPDAPPSYEESCLQTIKKEDDK